ncbi:probable ATP-dependent RNA helicase DDX27 [Thalassophryne amazonica]|uniref:probable ATP-dependent RNA helicase DDX27 n=1 Tax=Thalassophryne amazonica TaxID=390379 RepID=UPI001471E9A2|nr:probable ATP-dependent RNA helicase DDX27 [Thalassophryne amazonica]
MPTLSLERKMSSWTTLTWAGLDLMKQLKKKRTPTTLDQKIEIIRKKRKAEGKEGLSDTAGKHPEEGVEEDIKPETGGDDDDDDDDDEFDSADEEILTKSGKSNRTGLGFFVFVFKTKCFYEFVRFTKHQEHQQAPSLAEVDEKPQVHPR